MKQWIGWAITLILILTLWRCGKDKPLPTGYNEIFGEKEGIIADTLLVQQPGTEKFYSRLINTGTSGQLLLGRFDRYHSVIYLKFENLPNTSQVHSAKLRLTKNSADSSLGIPANQFSANFFLAEYDWANDQDPEQYLDQLPFNNPSFQSTIITADTSDQIEIALDTLVIVQWTDTSSTVSNYGMWIDSPDAEFISSYYSNNNVDATLLPQLELIYTFVDSAGSTQDTSVVYATKNAFLLLNSESDLNLNLNYFYIGKGFAFRSFIKFDLSSLDSTIHLNRAILKIVINKANSLQYELSASDCRIYRQEGASWNKSEVNEEPETSSYAGTLADSTLIFDITPTVQGWIGLQYPNYGFLIRSVSEEQTVSRVAFYSTKLSAELQPKLYLYYSLPPKQEF